MFYFALRNDFILFLFSSRPAIGKEQNKLVRQPKTKQKKKKTKKNSEFKQISFIKFPYAAFFFDDAFWINTFIATRYSTPIEKNGCKIVPLICQRVWHLIIVGYHLPFQHNELFPLPYMAVAEITLWISLRVRPEEPFLLLKYIITLSLILCYYY